GGAVPAASPEMEGLDEDAIVGIRLPALSGTFGDFALPLPVTVLPRQVQITPQYLRPQGGVWAYDRALPPYGSPSLLGMFATISMGLDLHHPANGLDAGVRWKLASTLPASDYPDLGLSGHPLRDYNNPIHDLPHPSRTPLLLSRIGKGDFEVFARASGVDEIIITAKVDDDSEIFPSP